MARFHVRVQPGARTTKWAGWFGELPKLAVKAPPVDGAANTAVVAEVAELFGVPARSVRLVGGAAARTKRLEVDGVTDADAAAIVESRLGGPANR
ncbi:MAG TPA: DUF167 domain-containing protein [Ilumatobacter sp.]|nr:DUF167 domain-containing protein [Ilumatobacter sp.]